MVSIQDNPPVTCGDSPAGPAPPLSASRTFPPVAGESALYTRGPFSGRPMAAPTDSNDRICRGGDPPPADRRGHFLVV